MIDAMFSVVQIIFAANMYGIPYRAFQSRLEGKPYKEGALSYELGMRLAGLPLLPIVLVHAMLRGLIGMSNGRLDKDETQRESVLDAKRFSPLSHRRHGQVRDQVHEQRMAVRTGDA